MLTFPENSHELHMIHEPWFLLMSYLFLVIYSSWDWMIHLNSFRRWEERKPENTDETQAHVLEPMGWGVFWLIYFHIWYLHELDDEIWCQSSDDDLWQNTESKIKPTPLVFVLPRLVSLLVVYIIITSFNWT